MKNPAPSPADTISATISDAEFAQFQRLIFQLAGISLSDSKKVLVVGRLSKRLNHFGFKTFGQYYRYIGSNEDPHERQIVVDLLTTNETYFFREPKHFDFLREIATQRRSASSFRVWSAASSTGEEAYSVAMVLGDVLGGNSWNIVGTDISSRVLEKARLGHYPLERAQGIPQPLLKRFCLKGVGEHEGTLLLVRELRERVEFLYSNLMAPRQGLGVFDIIFLRNVMIYFDNDTKRKVVSNLVPYMKEDGFFIVGHSESLNGITDSLTPVRPTIYRRAR